jgi:AraC-like DNA-binding protein
VKPLARYAALNGYVELGQSLGLDPVGLMKAEGLDPASLGLPDRWVPASRIARLLEKSAVAAGRQDVGLQLAERRRFATLGPLSLVLRDEPDVRSAVRLLMRSEHTYNDSLQLRLSEQDGVATIRVGLELGEIVECRQSVDLAVGALFRLLRGFLGSRWQPLAVCFAHPAPVDTTTHGRMFGPVVKFDHEFTGIVCYSSDLGSPNRMADPQLRPYAQQILDSLQTREEATTLNRVREVVELLLPTGRCSVEQVARSLGVDRRTVHRHLARSGETYSSVLDRTRVNMAARMVAYRRHSLTEVADRLGFSTPSNFSRWFRARFGCSPREWGR